jgi:hypothetical protein
MCSFEDILRGKCWSIPRLSIFYVSKTSDHILAFDTRSTLHDPGSEKGGKYKMHAEAAEPSWHRRATP